MQLPEKLTYLRKQKGLTQSNLAEALNVSRQAISRWEVGTAVPSTDNLKVLSALYSVPIDYLLNDNTDDMCKSAVTQTPPKDDSDRKATKKSRNVLICALIAIIVVFAVVTIILVGVWHKDESTAIVPLEDMGTIVDDNFQTEIFLFE